MKEMKPGDVFVDKRDELEEQVKELVDSNMKQIKRLEVLMDGREGETEEYVKLANLRMLLVNSTHMMLMERMMTEHRIAAHSMHPPSLLEPIPSV